MPRGLELVTGRVTAPGATTTALTANSGNSFAIRSALPNTPIWLLQAWGDFQAVGFVQIRSPRLHDNVRGIRLDMAVSDVAPLLADGPLQPLFPQDTLVVEAQGSAVAGDIETMGMLIYYEQLPGVDARLATWEQIRALVKHRLTVEATLALGTSGDYTGEEAITAESDLLKGNTDYALIGYSVDAECGSIRIRGVDMGNLGVGGPGNDSIRHYTPSWFKMLSLMTGLPLIPVFNSANRAAILLDGVQDENGTDVTLLLNLVELGPSPALTLPGAAAR